MNEQQALSAIRNAVRLENLSADTARKITPELRRILAEVQRQVASLPEGSVERELFWRQVQPRLASLFRGVNDEFYQELRGALQEAAPGQVEWAQGYLQKAEGAVAAAPLGPLGEITRTQLLALTDDTQVLGSRLSTLFGWEDVADSPFMKAQVKHIDRVVKQGFLLSRTNDEIARDLVQATQGSIRDARAIARTAVMDMSQRAHERFWNANDDVIVEWEFDASLDYRVCLECAPYDGQTSKERSGLPEVPVHPNCRCRVLPITETEKALQAEELQRPREMTITEITKDRADATGRVYRTPAKIDGEKYTKFAREVRVPRGQKATMGYFLANANRQTKIQVLGLQRTKAFENLTQRQGGAKISPEEALRRVIKMDFSKRR